MDIEKARDYYRTNFGEHPDWEEYRQAEVDEKRLLIRIQIKRTGPDRREQVCRQSLIDRPTHQIDLDFSLPAKFSLSRR